MSFNAPPGGGPNATVIASSQGAPAPVVSDPNQIAPSAPNPQQPQVPNAPVAPAPDALNLAPAVTPTAPEQPTRVDLDFEDSGINASADYFVNTLGLDPNGPELTEAVKGNFAYLESKIATLGDKAKGAAPFLNLAKDSVSRLKDTATKRHAETVTSVHQAVGGEANWKAVQHWARTSLQPNQLAEASSVLSQGGLAAEAMAKHLLSLATNSPQVSITGQNAVSPEAAAASLQGYAPLTREQYRNEYKALVKECGGISAAQRSPKLAALNARANFK